MPTPDSAERMRARLGVHRRPQPPSDPDAREAWVERIVLDAEAHMEQLQLEAEERAERGL